MPLSQQITTSIPIGNTGRYTLHACLKGHDHIEIIDYFYLIDNEGDREVEYPLGKLEDEDVKVTFSDILKLIKMLGFRIVTHDEAKIVKSMLSRWAKGEIGQNQILLYFTDRTGCAYGLDPYKDDPVNYDFKKKEDLRKIFDNQWGIEYDVHVAVVCIRL